MNSQRLEFMPASSSKTQHPLSRKPTARESKAFSISHQNVLLERMEGNIQMIADGHVLLREKLDGLEVRMETRFNEVDRRFDAVDRRFDRLEGRADRLEGDIGQLKESQARMEGDIVQFKEGQDRLEEIAKEILQRVKSLESRVAAVEARLQVPMPATSIPDEVSEKIRQLEQRIAFLESHVA